MRFATFVRLGEGVFWGAIRFGRGPDLAWHCEHEHGSRANALRCAYHAEYMARVAGLLPAVEQCRWNDPATWPAKVKGRLERAHYRL